MTNPNRGNKFCLRDLCASAVTPETNGNIVSFRRANRPSVPTPTQVMGGR
jgi:hypothetical protein